MARRVCLSRLLSALGAVGCACSLGACADALQYQTLGTRAALAAVSTRAYPVYWLGRAFHGLPLSGLTHDSGGAYTMAYGVCVIGGQNTCVTALRVVTSPDNSFVPGGSQGRSEAVIRGRRALLADRGATIELASGSVVLDIYANSARLAYEAARDLFPINAPGAPRVVLPAPTADSHWETVPPGGPTRAYVPRGPTGPTGLGAVSLVTTS